MDRKAYFLTLSARTHAPGEGEFHVRDGYILMSRIDFAVGIGGENGQGIASTGDVLARIFARRGLHLNAYNAYQSIIRGGHTFLTIRAGESPIRSMGDRLDILIPLNQDAMDRHLRLMTA